MDPEESDRQSGCQDLKLAILADRRLIIAANRGPVTMHRNEQGEIEYQRGGGGLVTALTALAQHVDATWIACASTETDSEWEQGELPLGKDGASLRVKFITASPEAFDGYYNKIANPLLWFLQHNMWDIARSPTIDRKTWDAWENGYVQVNRMFAQTIAEEIMGSQNRTLVMVQDYQLYLVPSLLRELLRRKRKDYTITYFVHIPWPGSEDWGILPPAMRRMILEGLCAADLAGFQTREDALNFIRTCESYLPRAFVKFRRGRIWYKNHATYVRDFPISIDVQALRDLAASEEVTGYHELVSELAGPNRLILRIDRTEPSKNIVRGFQAMDEFLELYPDYKDKVRFLALLVPSRMSVEEYQDYLDELMAAAGRVNAKHGNSEWEPVRVLVGENYPRAIAALQQYDVLLVNSIADGMNLVAKEGPIVNQRNGVVILSERTGARQQLESGAMIISPCDIYATAHAMHQALTMPAEEREENANRLRWVIEREDISEWLCRQLEEIDRLNL